MKRKQSSPLVVLSTIGLMLFFCLPGTSTTSARNRIADRESIAPLQQSNQNIDGFWQGTLEAGGARLRLLMKFTRAADGTLKGKLDSLDQGAFDLPITLVTFENGALHVEMKNLGATYDGRLSADGMQITGEFTQGAKIPLVLKRVEKAEDAGLKRPQTPSKPYPYEELEVTYENKTDRIKLAATLTEPRGAGPFPAVVLITGSGAEDRNETVFGHQPFLVLADYLTRRGIAVLRADDRGMGGTSKGSENDTSENYAGDALAGVEFLKTRKEINPKQIGLIGHSEGGMIAPIAATRSNDVAFIVLMAGPGISGDKVITMQTRLIIASECGQSVDISMAQFERVFAIARTEKDAAVARQKIQAEDAANAAATRKQLESQLDAAANRINQLVSPWFYYFLNFDPRPTLMKVRVPVLAMNGANDVQVPPKEDLAGIEQALKDGGNHDYKIVLFPKLNHLFQSSTTGAPSEYAGIEETIAPVALQTMGDWIVAHTLGAH